MVFLHGLFGQGRNFTQIAKAMLPEFHSLLVDLPNHGRSGWTDTFSYAATADRIAEHLAEGFAADGPVHVVGHSMGGKVAMLLALRHPELVERLVVVDIAPVPSDNAGEFEHLLGSLAGLELDGLTRRSDADEQLSEAIPDERVRGFLLQNLRSSSDGFTLAGQPGPAARRARRDRRLPRGHRHASTTRCSGWPASAPATSPRTPSRRWSGSSRAPCR